jgi:phage terminase large subunit
VPDGSPCVGHNGGPPLVNTEIAEPCLFLVTEKARFKGLYGGRGGAKSWSIARALIIIAMREYPENPTTGAPTSWPIPDGSAAVPCLIVCLREFQTTIRDSVHRIISQQIFLMGLGKYFKIEKGLITCLLTGAEFIFKGISRDPNGVRSLEGGKYWWLEEAHNISRDSWEIIEPTARRRGSEIWVSYNPDQWDDPTHLKLVSGEPEDILNEDTHPRAIIRKVNWKDNPWFPPDLDLTRRHMLRTDPEAYDHIWGGNTRRLTDAVIFKNKYKICTFETPHWARLRYGADFGFSQDPSTLIRFWMGPPLEELQTLQSGDNKSKKEDCLYIDQEAYAVGVDLKEMKAFYNRVDGAQAHPIKCDNSRPETISYLRGEGFNTSAADKWPGSVEDGIAHMRGFTKIYIHESCKWTATEFRLYSYKVDKKTGLILTDIVDAHNHCIPAHVLITTQRGKVPVPNVRVGDCVLTRSGYQKVTFADVTDVNRATVYLVTIHGHVLQATPDHRVWTQRGLVRMDAMQYGDCVYTQDTSCPAVHSLERSITMLSACITRAWFGGAIRTRNAAATGFITPTGIKLYTSGRGRTITGMFLRATMCTTKMAIQVTTLLITWSALLLRHTWRNTRIYGPRNVGQPQGSGFLKHSLPYRLGGIVRRVWNTTSTKRSFLSQRGTRGFAQCVVSNSKTPLPVTQKFTGVLPSVHPSTAGTVGWIMSQNAVSNAASHLLQTNMTPNGFVASPVLCVVDGPRAKAVYDLTVEQDHEFVADGILVSNCIDAIRYGLDGYIQNRGTMGIWRKLANRGKMR